MATPAPPGADPAPPPAPVGPAPGQAPVLVATTGGELGQTAILGLWVPVLVGAHLFAGFWLYKAWRLNAPSPAKRVRRSSGGAAGSPKPSPWKQLQQAHWPGGKAGGAQSAGLPVTATAASSPIKSDAAPARAHGLVENDLIVEADMLDGGAPASDEPDAAAEADQARLLRALEAGGIGGGAGAGGGEHRIHHDNHGRVVAGPADYMATASLEWRGVGCSYAAAGGTKEVLVDVWGVAPSGEMQALLGPSGAGKSTLMDILAMRKSLGNLTGKLLVNGERATRRFVRMTAYVPQEDNFVPTMTTEETLGFYADIILPNDWSKQRRRERIAEVLAEVGLLHARATIVGGTLPGGLLMRGLSGGERKRLSVASGILAAPTFLFLDEPTSGLDSFAALTVMGYLKRLAREHGRVVISSIHQPRSAIWTMFDAVTLLANGRLMYHGPRDEMTTWFASLGYPYDHDLHGVASDWALDLVAIGFPKPPRFYGHTITTKEQLLAAAAAFKDQYLADMALASTESGSGDGLSGELSEGDAASPRPRAARVGCAALLARRAEGAADGDGGGGGEAEAAAPRYATSAWRQFKTLLWRELLAITRNPFDVAGRTLTFAWVGVFMGILSYGIASDAASLQPRMTLLHMVLCFYLLMPYISMGLYAADKKFVVADASSQLYRPLAYYLAKVCAITPFHIVTASVYGLMVYGMAGLRPGAGHIFKNGVINVLTHLIASQVLHASAVVAPNQDVAFMLSIVWTAVQMLLSGFFIDFKGVYLHWATYLRYLSTVYFGFQAVVSNEYEGVLLPCTGAGTADGGSISHWLGSALPNTSNAQRKQLEALFGRYARDGGCVFDPSGTLDHYNINRPYWLNAGVLMAYLVVMHFVTFGCMLLTVRRERR